MWRLKSLDLHCLSHISVLSLSFCLQITNKKLQKLSLFIFKINIADLENNSYIVGHDYLTLVRLLTGIITLAMIILPLLHWKGVK